MKEINQIRALGIRKSHSGVGRGGEKIISHMGTAAADELCKMSTISSTSTGISDLMQMFSSTTTPALSSLLSSSPVQSALAKAPPADVVQLSDEAMQLQEVDKLFGGSTASTTESSGQAMQELLTLVYSGTK
jgi:hypothetical protein